MKNRREILGLVSLTGAGLVLANGATGQVNENKCITVNIDDYGASGTFNPDSPEGYGSHDTDAFIQAIDAIKNLGGGIITARPGGMYFITGEVKIESAENIHLKTRGAKFYKGVSSHTFVFSDSVHCSWEGAYIIGDGNGGGNRENDSLILISNKSRDIDVYGHYLTNCLGDCITISGNVLVPYGGINLHCIDIRIHDGVLKERYGDQQPSRDGGSMSREAIAVIDASEVRIYNNTIYGSIDLEPNINGQHIVNCLVSNNILSVGHVTPDVGNNRWADEEINFSGNGLISGDIKLQGIAGNPIVYGNKCVGNIIEHGQIITSRKYEFDDISDNTFIEGSIVVGEDTVIGSAKGINIENNTCRVVFPNRNGFIDIRGQISGCAIKNNIHTGLETCLYVGATTQEDGSNDFSFDQGNIFIGNLAPYGRSHEGNFSERSRHKSNSSIDKLESLVVITDFSGDSAAISWEDYYGSSWYIQQPVSSLQSIAEITEAPNDGAILEIMAEASGGGTLTIRHSSSIILKGGQDAQLTNTNAIGLRRNFGRWVEVYRNF